MKTSNTFELLKAAQLSRRSLMKSAVAVGAVGFASPALVKNALSSSGELNFIGWAGYKAFAETVFPAFTAGTGIKVNFIEQPDNDGIFAAAKIASTAGGVDMIEPTIDTVGQYASNGLVAAWDEAKLAMGNYLPGLADGAAGERSRKEGKLLYVPSNWGTEALVYNKEKAVFADGQSLAALFDPANKVVVRPRSAITAMGRLLEKQGKLPRPWLDGYTDMAAMTQLWDIALAECVKAKANVVQFWAGENDANAGFVVTAMPHQRKAHSPGTRVSP
jgi:spermidine/putrescine transport system substrate-binding protein